MRWVDQAITRPFRCAIVPYLGNNSGHRFIDTQQDLDREHVYVSDVAAEHMAEMLGWVPPQVLRSAELDLVQARMRVGELEAKLEEYEAMDEDIAGLTKRGWQVRKPQGRKPKVEA